MAIGSKLQIVGSEQHKETDTGQLLNAVLATVHQLEQEYYLLLLKHMICAGYSTKMHCRCRAVSPQENVFEKM